MTRSAARELAVLIAASAAPGESAEELLDRFFEREHYETLAAEGPQFEEFPNKRQMEYIRAAVTGVLERREELDGIIQQYAHGWKPERLSRTTGSILRCALYEILHVTDVPPGAAVNEAVELAKKYEGGDAPAFINGVLGSYLRAQPEEEPPAPEAGE